MRRDRGLPELNRDFDIFYYSKQYAPLIEDLSLHYASNIAKKFRFANRITRIGKLNDIAESILDRIRSRETETLTERTEKLHNENIKLFQILLGAIDDNMGKLKVTRIDLNVNNANKVAQLENPEQIRKLIEDTLKRYNQQLPSSIDANFSEITDYDKCSFAERWTNCTHCKFYNEPCRVETGESKVCPKFLNNILLSNQEWVVKRYVQDELSVKTIAELAGCKEVDDRTINYIKGKLKLHGAARPTGASGGGELSVIPVGQVENLVG